MSYRLELGLALLVAGAIGGAMIAANPTAKPAARDYRASTPLSGPEGRPALYRVPARLRLPRAARVLAPRPLRGRLEGLVKRSVAGESGDQCVTLVAQARDTLIAATDGRPVVLRLHYAGGGTITLAADVGWFRNQVW